MAGSDIKAGGAYIRLFLKDDLTKQMASALKSASSAVKSAGDFVQGAGTKLAAAGAGISAPLLASLVVGANFQDVMLDIKASTGATAAELDRLKAAAMSSKVGPEAAATAFRELLKAGMSVEDVLGGAGEAAIAFARVGRMDAGEAATVMADAMHVFGVTADVAANTISSAADASSTDIAGMSQAFSQVSAVAQLANQSISDTATALALLANAGVKGSDAGTSLKTMLLKLMAPTDTTTTGLGQLGLTVESFRDASGKMLPLVQILDKLETATRGLGQVAKDEAFAKIFGTDAIRAAAILGAAGSAGFGKMKDGMAGAMSVGQKLDTLMSGLSGKKDRFLASLERIAIVVSEGLEPAVAKLEPIVTSVVKWVGEFVVNNKDLIPGLAAVAAGLTVVGTAMGALGFAMGPIATGLGVLSAFAGSTVGASLIAIALAAGTLAALDWAGLIDLGPAISELESLGQFISGEFAKYFADLKTIVTDTWVGVVSSIKAGDWKAAATIAGLALEATWAATLERIATAFDALKMNALQSLAGIVIQAAKILPPDLFAKMFGVESPTEALVGKFLAGQAAQGQQDLELMRRNTAGAEMKLRAYSLAAQAGLGKGKGGVNAPAAPAAAATGAGAADVQAELGKWLASFQSMTPEQQQKALTDIRGQQTPLAKAVQERFGLYNAPAASAPMAPEVAKAAPQWAPELGPTFSAAAAQAAGQMGSVDTPQERMVTSLHDMRTTLEELGLIARDQLASNKSIEASYQRFLDAFVYAA